MTTTPTSDPLAALAAELGHIGRRLDGMGAELLALRAAGADGMPTPPEGQTVVLPVGELASVLDVPRGAAPEQAGPAVAVPQGSPYPPGAAAAPYGVPPWTAPPAGLGPVPGWQAPGWGPAAPPPAGPPPAAPPPAAPPPAAPSPAGPSPAGPSSYGSSPYGPSPYGQAHWGPAPAPSAAPAASKRSPFTGARLLAWTGGAVTLLGVVLLLALAASRGWFTPPARVAFGAMLGAGLVGLGVWLHRRETARAGALALVATGFATLYLVVAAATAIFGYLPPIVGLLLALVVAGAGLGLADRWRTELLAGGVVVGAAVLAPALADGWLLVALALVLQLAALFVVMRRRWAVLMLLAAAGPVLYGMHVVVTEDDVWAVVGVAAAVLVVALATAALAVRRPSVLLATTGAGDPSAVAADAVRPGSGEALATGGTPGAEPGAASPRTWIGSVAAVVAAAVLPALVGASTLGGWRAALLAGGAALLLAILAVLPATPRAVKVSAGAAAVVALLAATVVGLDGAPAVLAVLGEAVVAALVAAGLRSRFAMITALVLGGLGWLGALHRAARIETLVTFVIAPTVPELVTAVAAGALIVALAAALLVAGGRLGWIRPDASRAAVWVPIGLAGLYGAAGVVVNAALLISPTSTGFTAGHAVVTVSWTVGALFLLARGLRRPALRVAGLVLVAAAVAKLVLFDLVALDGLARVAAFLGAGLVLLAAGARYTRLVAEAEKTPPSE